MEEGKIELPAEEVFVLLKVSTNLESRSKWQEKYETNDDENESLFTFDDDDDVQTDIKPQIDVTPTDDVDYSSSDSVTINEIEEKRWYNPLLMEEIRKSDFNLLKSLFEVIKNVNPTSTRRTLYKLKEYKLTDECFQNMFITLNGFEVFINMLECKDDDDCVKIALIIIQDMSIEYASQCSLCNLGAIKPLINILLFYKNIYLHYLAIKTLYNISKIRKGRKLIRLCGGIPIIVDIMRKSKDIFSIEMKNLNEINQTMACLMSNCSMILEFLCRSSKSQEALWNTGFTIEFLPQLSQIKHIDIQASIMGLVSNCCRPSSNVLGQKMNVLHKTLLKELNILPQIMQFIQSNTIKLVLTASETILFIFDDDFSVYDVLLNHKGMEVLFKAIKKFDQEPIIMISIMKMLWKGSLNIQCRQIIEKDSAVVTYLNDLLSYELDDCVVGYAIGTLSELWKSENMQPRLKDAILPKLLDILQTSMHSIILTHVFNVLSIASCDPECLKLINAIDGFQLVFMFLASWDITNWSDYQDFYEPGMIIAAVQCLTEIIKNTPLPVNILKGMYGAICDVVDLLTHENMDVVAAVCSLIEVIVLFDENFNILINEGAIENLVNLVTKDHVNLRVNLCRALGKCCTSKEIAKRLSCQNAVGLLLKYIESEHQIVRENVVIALNGLSNYPLNCDIMNFPRFISFAKDCMTSTNREIADAAVECLRNINNYVNM